MAERSSGELQQRQYEHQPMSAARKTTKVSEQKGLDSATDTISTQQSKPNLSRRRVHRNKDDSLAVTTKPISYESLFFNFRTVDKLRFERLEAPYTGDPITITSHPGGLIGQTIEFAGLLAITQDKESTSYHFQPTTDLKKKIGYEGNILTLRTPEVAWLATVLERARSGMISGLGWVELILLAAENIEWCHTSIDFAEMDLPDPYCRCQSVQEQARTSHFCHGCANDTLCVDLPAITDGLRLCVNCTLQPPKEMTLRSDTLRKIIVQTIDVENKARKCLSEDEKDGLVDAIYKELAPRFDASKCGPRSYPCRFLSFSKAPRQTTTCSSRTMTLHAAFPFGYVGSRAFKYAAGNVELVPRWMSIAMDGWLPGVLGEIARWWRAERSLEATQTLVERVDEMHIIHLGLPNSTSAQMSFFDGLSSQQIKAMVHEWTTCQIQDPRLSERQQNPCMIVNEEELPAATRKYVFSQQQRQDIINIVTEISIKFKTQKLMKFSADGTPWPMQCGHIPANWSWKLLYDLAIMHMEHISKVYGTLWEKNDEKKLTVEMFYRLNSNEYTSTSLFGLPLNFSIGHPFCLKFTKVSIDKEFSTGWSKNARSLADRGMHSNCRVHTEFEARVESACNPGEHEIVRSMVAPTWNASQYCPHKQPPPKGVNTTTVQIKRCPHLFREASSRINSEPPADHTACHCTCAKVYPTARFFEDPPKEYQGMRPMMKHPEDDEVEDFASPQEELHTRLSRFECEAKERITGLIRDTGDLSQAHRLRQLNKYVHLVRDAIKKIESEEYSVEKWTWDRFSIVPLSRQSRQYPEINGPKSFFATIPSGILSISIDDYKNLMP